MRKWQDLAAPDDPGSWYAVGNMWPTRRGTYETADFSTGTSKTATGGSFVYYAFAAKTLSGAREYVYDGAKIWEYSSGSLTDRTGGVSIGSYPMMAQYGNITICVAGTSTATISSSGGNFAALAGAPMGEIICVQSNAVLVFNTSVSADGWAASDVGDYTNWSTGESASGRIITTPGPILAAVPYGNDVLVFKADSIYRMTYVGGVVKWQIQLVWRGLGASYADSSVKAKYQAVATNQGVAFNANSGATNSVYLFDGSSPPKPLNQLTTLALLGQVFVYNPVDNILTLAPSEGSNASGLVDIGSGTTYPSLYYYYSFETDQWGAGAGCAEENRESGTTYPTSVSNGVLQGDYYARAETSSKPVYWRFRSVTTGAHYRCAPSAPGSASSCYLQTSKIGSSEAKTTFDRLTPQLRRRTDLGTDSASLEMTLFREREDTSAQTTRTISESSARKRFDLNGGACSDNFARFKVTWTALDVEVDDFIVKTRPAGLE